ncbi:MAG: hypothetical protein WBD59_11540, partial [Candidatus Sulfotelmatobacter sp.]
VTTGHVLTFNEVGETFFPNWKSGNYRGKLWPAGGSDTICGIPRERSSHSSGQPCEGHATAEAAAAEKIFWSSEFDAEISAAH